MSNKKCFSLENVARPLNSAASLTPQPETPKSVPLVSTLIEVGPPPPKIRRRAEKAECAVAIYPYTRDAATIWEACTKQEATLWQVQLEHNARDSITIGFYESFTKFLQQEESAPDSIKDLAEAGMKLILTDTSDPDQIGFIRWRVAFYVAGEVADLHNLLHLLDMFFVWVNQDRSPKVTARSVCSLKLRSNSLDRSHMRVYNRCIVSEICYVLVVFVDKNVSSFYPYLGVEIGSIWESLSYQEYLMYDPARKVPLLIFDAQPPQGKRVMNVKLEQQSEEEVSLIFHGCTWHFRDALEGAGVRALRYEDNLVWKYVHVLTINVSKEEDIAKVDSVFRDALKSLACRVLDSKTLKSEVKAFIARVGEQHEQLHFV